MRIVFFGVEALGERCLNALFKAGHKVVGVVTVPTEAPPARPWYARLLSGRGPQTVEAIARARRIPVLMPKKLKDPAFLAQLSEWRPDLIVVACFDKILPPAALELSTHGGLNVHPSLLPRHRGPAPVARAILAGDHETGISVHVMEATIDTGAIVVQHRHPIGPDVNAGELSQQLAKVAPKALLEAISGLFDGSRAPVDQTGRIRQAPFISREEGQLDWRSSVGRLMLAVRACSPYPGAFAVADGAIVAVLKAKLEIGDPDALPGQVLVVEPEGVVIQAGDGAVRCLELRSGGRIISPKQYGDFFSVGDVLPSGDWSALETID